MRQSEWEMEKTKSKAVGGVWPLASFSSCLPTFIPLDPLLLISHSVRVAYCLAMFVPCIIKDAVKSNWIITYRKLWQNFALIVIIVIKPPVDSAKCLMILPQCKVSNKLYGTELCDHLVGLFAA